MTPIFLVAGAWLLEVIIGWPDWLYKRIRHPVVWIGMLISKLEVMLNHSEVPHAARYALGAVASTIVVAISAAIAWGLTAILPNVWWGYASEILIASSLIASRSLYAHVSAVAQALGSNDICSARYAVSQIVGRDPANLDESGIASASLESLAENASDGVVAPLFWGAVFGLPGLAGYKAINTLDSMIGHRNDRYRAFGGFAARLDDLANLIPARLTGVLIAAASLKPFSFRIMFGDAGKHRSPNAGWPEAAMAGGLGVKLSGPRIYDGNESQDPWLNQNARNPIGGDVNRGLALYRAAMGLGAALLFAALMCGAHDW